MVRTDSPESIPVDITENNCIGACSPHLTCAPYQSPNRADFDHAISFTFQRDPLFDAAPFNHTRLHPPSNKKLHCPFGPAHVACPIFGLLVAPTRWAAQARGVHAGDRQASIKHAFRRVCKSRRRQMLTNYDRCDRHQHKARQKKVACNPVEQRQYLICNSRKLPVLIDTTCRPNS